MHEGKLAEAAIWLDRALTLSRRPEASPDVQAGLHALLGIAALRRGEIENCLECLGPSSCIFPLEHEAVHLQQAGSREAVKQFTAYLEWAPGDLRVRWLLNLAYMTLGEYPEKVPPAFSLLADQPDNPDFPRRGCRPGDRDHGGSSLLQGAPPATTTRPPCHGPISHAGIAQIEVEWLGVGNGRSIWTRVKGRLSGIGSAESMLFIGGSPCGEDTIEKLTQADEAGRTSSIVVVEPGRWAAWAIGLACLTALVAACFGGVLFGGRQFAFRDSAHFYYPLYFRVQQEWAAGRIPLWEPGENGGRPQLGSPMAAVLYPCKVLFALVAYPWGARLYIVAHEVLAFGAMLALARHWGVSRAGAILAGLCYAFGGPVLSDYFNVIYLVGAAWAPLGFRAADRWLRLGRRSALIELTLVLAMQVLGGDPQAAYITVLCALGYAIGLARARRPSPGRPLLRGIGLLVALVGWTWVGPAVASRIHGSGGRTSQAILAAAWIVGILVYVANRPREQRTRVARMLMGLVGSGTLAIALAGAQVLPVLDHIAKSVRWPGAGPIDLYDSSLLPDRVVEWVWPNVFGTFVAGNHYWMRLLPPAGSQRPWPLSLSMGTLPLILAIGAAGFRNGPPWRAWMTTVALISFGAGLGEFAGLARWSSAGPSPTAGDDSLHGLLTTTLPGLRLFRLPFKLLVFTNLAMAALAGIGWDGLAAGVGRRRAVAITTGLLALTVLILVASAIQRNRIAAAMAAVPHSFSSVYGPLDSRGGGR
jgi:hypothetical protein